MNKLYKECKSLFNDSIAEDMDDNWMLDKEENKKNTKNTKKVKKNERKFVYLQNSDNFSLFEGSDDYIRNIFKKYITHFLADIHLSQHISKIETLDNEKKLSKLKDVLNDYNCNFILNWITKTKNFLFWNYEHDKKLWNLSPHLKKCKNITKYYENGDIYEGEVAFGEPNKSGKLDFTIKEIPYTYVGEFSNGLKEGNGNLFSKDNQFNYDGEWKNDKYEGFGALFDHGEKYTGDFKNGKFHGNGNLYKLNGDAYEGEFFEGKIKKGKITFKSGDFYEGEFENGIFNGKGTYKYKNGDIFKGKFLEGKKKFGNLEFAEGGKYEGYFENELYNGEGILINKNGEELKGIFKDGELVEKLDKLKIEIEKEQEILNDGINIEIKQDNDWEIAEVKNVEDKNKDKEKKKDKNGLKKNKKEDNKNVVNEKKEKNIKEDIKKDKNNVEDNNINENDNNYIHNIMENNINMTTDSLDVVSFSNMPNESMTKEESNS